MRRQLSLRQSLSFLLYWEDLFLILMSWVSLKDLGSRSVWATQMTLWLTEKAFPNWPLSKTCNFMVKKSLQFLPQDFHINDICRFWGIFPPLSHGLLKSHMCRSKKIVDLASFERTLSVPSLIIFIMVEDIIDFFLLIHPNDSLKMRLLLDMLLPWRPIYCKTRVILFYYYQPGKGKWEESKRWQKKKRKKYFP